MAQWPSDPHLLAKTWTKVAHGTRIVELCSKSLLPVTSRGLTVFHTRAKLPTELTCSLKFKPGAKVIDSTQFVTISMLCLFMTMHPTAALAFCKGKWTFEPSPFWERVRVILAPAIDIPPTVEEATRIENPQVRSFVLRCWYRLRSRLGYQETERVLVAACNGAAWPNGPWTKTICKWMKQLQTPIVVTTLAKADIFIGRVPIGIPRRDKVTLSLMILFREPLAYGERHSESELSKALQFDTADALFKPQACFLHHGILLAMKWRTQFLQEDTI
jgi:hypothetical protein